MSECDYVVDYLDEMVDTVDYALSSGMWLDYKQSVSVKSGQAAAWFGSVHEASDAQKCRDRYEAPPNRHRLA